MNGYQTFIAMDTENFSPALNHMMTVTLKTWPELPWKNAMVLLRETLALGIEEPGVGEVHDFQSDDEDSGVSPEMFISMQWPGINVLIDKAGMIDVLCTCPRHLPLTTKKYKYAGHALAQIQRCLGKYTASSGLRIRNCLDAWANYNNFIPAAWLEAEAALTEEEREGWSKPACGDVPDDLDQHGL